MQKLFLPLLFTIVTITTVRAQKRLFDQPVQMKSCNISIEANPFIATTVIELEFYNSNDQEVEGRQDFRLNRGQVITDFQLELNGKYREGSIEERWKARAAYSSIVGKRIDPALLQMNGTNDYYINIYPIAAKSSRKVKFTITQMMLAENLKLTYSLPLNFKTLTSECKVNIKVSRLSGIPSVNDGLLRKQVFDIGVDEASLSWQANDFVLDQPISFTIRQFTNQPQFCISRQDGKTNFLMRLNTDVPRYYQSKSKAINVYWDVSLSANNRDLIKELDFLDAYISTNAIDRTNIILFNQQLQGVITFNRAKDNFNSIRNYLLNYKYAGATQLGILDFSSALADAIFLFSDGINSVGKSQPKPGTVPVNFVQSSSSYRYLYWRNDELYKNIIDNTGGSVIDLYEVSTSNAVRRADTAENFLFKYNSPNIRINEPFPLKLGAGIVLSGSISQAGNLELLYGNNSAVAKTENFFLSDNQLCDETTYKKIKMLKAYDSLLYGGYNYYHWQDMVVFGLTERVVTPQTSFLVLERIEDYINYKIAPPKELEEKCAEMNYVYKSEYKIQALKSFTEQDVLESVVKEFNKRISWWSKNETQIDLKRVVPDNNVDMAAASNTVTGKVAGVNVQNYSSANPGGGGDLREVVVTGAFGTKRAARSMSSSAQNISTEQLSVVRQIDINNAIAGKVAGAQVRSQSYAKLGAETSIRLRGENGLGAGAGALYVVNGTVMTSSNDINPDDIEDITVLQGPSATALFGPDGANGAIVINIKRAKRAYSRPNWSEYKLSGCEEVDYVQEIRSVEDYETWDAYLKLEKENKTNVGFYFEMANFFFEKGKTDRAQELMYNAIELSNGNTAGLKLAAYLYEDWKWFDKAIDIYEGILSQQKNDLLLRRDLALAYFQNKNFAASVKTYYSIITTTNEDNSSVRVKENALAEMNAIIAVHKNEFDISYINRNLIKMVPVDLRITVESNYGYTRKVQFVEPGNTKCDLDNPNTVNNGRYSGSDYYYDYKLHEYAIKNAPGGKYRVKVDAYNNYSSAGQVPMFIRVITFKNFQKENMEMEVKLFDLDNQYGGVELDEINW